MSDQEKQVDELFDAVENKDLDAVKSLISQGLSPNAKNSNDENIMQAMMRMDNYIPDHQDIVNYLIEQGADIHHVGGLDLTLLHIAALADMYSTVERLLERKIDYTAKSAFGKTALFYTHNAKMVELLISKNAGAMQDTDENGDTLLHNAGGSSPKFDLIKYLIKHIDINTKNKDGDTLLIDILDSAQDPEDAEEILDYLLSQGADINSRGQYGRSPFLAAVRNRNLNLNVLKKLINAGADITQKDENGASAVHYSSANNLTYLKFFVEKNADINSKTIDNDTALIIATQYEREEVVAFLLLHNVDLDIRDKHGKTALNYALEGEFSDIYTMLNNKNASATPLVEIEKKSIMAKNIKSEEEERKRNEITDLNSAIRLKNLALTKKYYKEITNDSDATSSDKYELGMYAIENGTLEIFKYLIENGVNINAKDENGYSFLHDAVFNNKIDIAEYLVNKGLDVDYISDDESSVYSMSANSSVEMVNFLLKSGVKVDKEKEENIVSIAVHYCNPEMAEYFIKQGYKLDESIFEDDEYLIKLIQKQNTKMFTFLIKMGLEVETKVFVYGDKATLLHLAVMLEAAKVVDFLLAAGANPNARNTDDKPVYHQAFKNANIDIVETLYDNGAELEDTSGFYDYTPLLLSLESQKIEITRFLIKKGANVNAVDSSEKNSALHMAAQRGYLEIIKSMVEQGGNVELLNKARKAPLDVAVTYEKKAVEAYLTEMEAKNTKPYT